MKKETADMMRNLALVMVLASISGCTPDDADAIREALPTADGVRIKVPGGASAMAQTADGVGATQLSLLGETADFYVFTRRISGDLNAGAAFVLLLVHNVVQYPVTSVDGDTYVWGPWTDGLNPAEWRLTARPNGSGAYEWALQGRRKADGPGAAFRAVVSGLATPGAMPNRGSGTFTMDFVVAEELDPVGNDGEGVLDVAYDLESEPRGVVMDWVNGLEAFHYEYAENSDGSGDFQFAMHADMEDDSGDLLEDMSVRSRWLATGPGRADILLSGGDLGATVVTASECWDATYVRVYWGDSVGFSATEGDEAACAFDAPLYSGE